MPVAPVRWLCRTTKILRGTLQRGRRSGADELARLCRRSVCDSEWRSAGQWRQGDDWLRETMREKGENKKKEDEGERGASAG